MKERMKVSEAEKKRWKEELLRVADACNTDNPTMDNYREHSRPGYSIDIMRKRLGPFNEVKKMFGLKFNAHGNGNSKENRDIRAAKNKEPAIGPKRPCNKCNRKFTPTKYNRIICPSCHKVNMSTYTEGGRWMNGNEHYHSIHAEGI